MSDKDKFIEELRSHIDKTNYSVLDVRIGLKELESFYAEKSAIYASKAPISEVMKCQTEI